MDSSQGSMASVAAGSWLVYSTRDKVSTVVRALCPLRWLPCIPETEESLCTVGQTSPCLSSERLKASQRHGTSDCFLPPLGSVTAPSERSLLLDGTRCSVFIFLFLGPVLKSFIYGRRPGPFENWCLNTQALWLHSPSGRDTHFSRSMISMFAEKLNTHASEFF